MWRGWWNGGDCVVGLYNEVVARRNCCGGMGEWKIIFAWGGSAMCHPPVLLFEAFNDGVK